MADKTVTVKSTGGTYTTLNEALSGENTANPDLTATGMNGILTIECYNLGANDTTAADTGTGWTTDSTHYIRIIGAPSEKTAGTTGKWSTSRYRLWVTDASGLIIRASYTRCEDLQIAFTSTTSQARDCYACLGSPSGLRFIRCIARANITADVSDHPRGFHFSGQTGGSADHYVVNCLAYDFKRGVGPTYGQGLRFAPASGGTLYLMNTTFHNCQIAAGREQGTAHAINNGMASCSTGLSGTWSTNTNNSTSSPTFVNEAGDDFHLAEGDTVWKDQGDGTTPKATFTDDVDGDARPATDLDWDVGYDEYVAGVSAPGIHVTIGLSAKG